MLNIAMTNGGPDLRSQTTQPEPGGHTGPGAGAGLRETFVMVVTAGLEPSHQATGDTNMDPPPAKFCRKLLQLFWE